MTPSAPEPPPKPVEKPVEKKPDPPKPVAETSPRKSRSRSRRSRTRRLDPIADALKADAKKPTPKQETKAAPPQPPKPKQERPFDQSKIAALLDKRDPTRQSITGATLNSSASLGTSHGTAATLSQSELEPCGRALRACGMSSREWNIRRTMVMVDPADPDRSLASPPQVVSPGTSPRYQAAAEAAVRAVLHGQPFNMLRDETYEPGNTWKSISIQRRCFAADLKMSP